MRQPYTQPKKMPMKKSSSEEKQKEKRNPIEFEFQTTALEWCGLWYSKKVNHIHNYTELGSTYPHLKYIQEKVNSHLMLYKLNNNNFMGIYERRRNTLEHGQYMLHILFIGSNFTFAEHDI